jgi:hypothetical protein
MAGMTLLSKVLNLAKILQESMIKYLFLYLEMIFSKNHEQAIM